MDAYLSQYDNFKIETDQVAISLAATLGAYGVYVFLKFFYGILTSPMRVLPGPPSPGFFMGHMKDLWSKERMPIYEGWFKKYGPTIAYNTVLGAREFMTTDLKAIQHITTRTDVYQKPEATRYTLTKILGNGVLVVEGAQHKNQRRIMNPGFGAMEIRGLTDIFNEKSQELRDLWLEQADSSSGAIRLDALSWMSRLTLDIIGLAGFNYHFNALQGDSESSELSRAFSQLFHVGTIISPVLIIRQMIPSLRWLPHSRDGDIAHARATMDRIGRELLRSSKAEAEMDGGAAKGSRRGKNLLTLLIQANMQTDLPAHQRMSDEDVLAQIPTFIVAGHETSSTATTWALYALCCNTALQEKLRVELLAVSTDNPTMDELNELPYLDAVVRETLRLYTPVVTTVRAAVKDDILPLGTPFTDATGKVHNTVHMRAGQSVIIPVAAIGKDKTIWGEDASEFRPERWETIPQAVLGIPNVWGNTLSFLAGPRACIGHRLAVVEIKAILFTLIRAFEFELGVSPEDVGGRGFMVNRPMVRSDPTAKNQLPIVVKPL